MFHMAPSILASLYAYYFTVCYAGGFLAFSARKTAQLYIHGRGDIHYTLDRGKYEQFFILLEIPRKGEIRSERENKFVRRGEIRM